MPSAEQLRRGVVVHQHSLGAPPDGHGDARGEANRDRRLQGVRPCFRRPENVGGPVELPQPRSNFALLEKLDAEDRLSIRGGDETMD